MLKTMLLVGQPLYYLYSRTFGNRPQYIFLFTTMHEVSMTLAGIIFRYVFQNSVCWLQLIPALPQQIDSLITINKLYSGRLVLLRIINYNFSGFTFGFYNFWIKLKHFFTSWVKFSITILATRIQRMQSNKCWVFASQKLYH